MNCQICNICVVNRVYDLSNGFCQDCGIKYSATGTYLGMNGDYHIFRLHNATCPECGAVGKYGQFQCDDGDGIDVTDEFAIINQHHWAGK